MTRQLVQSWRNQLLERHEQSKLLDDELKKLLQSKILLTWETAALVTDAKGALNEEDFDAATDFISDENVRAYLNFIKRNPDKPPGDDLARSARELREVLMMSGALDFPQGHGPQQLAPLSFFPKAVGMAMTFASMWSKFIARRPIASWAPGQAEQFLASLSPFMRAYKAVQSSLSKKP